MVKPGIVGLRYYKIPPGQAKKLLRGDRHDRGRDHDRGHGPGHGHGRGRGHGHGKHGR